MRRTIRRHPPVALSALALALTITLAGCADRTDSGKDVGNSVSSSPTTNPTTGPSPSTSPTPSPADCAPAAPLGVGDSGRTVCLAVGDTVRISLDGTSERPWKPLTANGSGLEAANSGVVLLPGDASAAFAAVATGRTRLESTRPLCAAGTGRVSCKGIQEWWVTVVVK
ncbi:hypothetical protein ACOT81_31990 [Streptomyces sp. WI04-05B]|uniref:hypothetical protein n=1 Tax=Streptomyces TaxID=1883 RepID=UPI0029AC78A2|nr:MULTISPECIES: hypothetical protein [unclassified Streptomyces]MDX2542087.1 hypothetical protein [Streptomyces sp. WI04-05B]MDX2583919.1 hypothetical protein [Streptomyces sp. WI04-05A]